MSKDYSVLGYRAGLGKTERVLILPGRGGSNHPSGLGQRIIRFPLTIACVQVNGLPGLRKAVPGYPVMAGVCSEFRVGVTIPEERCLSIYRDFDQPTNLAVQLFKIL